MPTIFSSSIGLHALQKPDELDDDSGFDYDSDKSYFGGIKSLWSSPARKKLGFT